MVAGVGALAGGGGLSASSSATSSATGRSGDSSGTSGTGHKTFNIGGNPNLQTANTALLVGAALVAVFLLTRSSRPKSRR